MAKKSKVSKEGAPLEEQVKAEVKEAAQPDLFKVLRFKKGIRSISIPYLREGKVEWVDTFESSYDESAQNTLFDFWRKMKEENPTFDIEAKKAKLFEVE